MGFHADTAPLRFGWVAVALTVLLAACSISPPRPAADPERLWQVRRQQLSELNHWRLEGRIGFISERDSGSASLYWEQNGPTYELRVVAPLGQGTLWVRGGPDGVVLKTDEGEKLQAEDAEYLIWRRTGWVIPVSSLRYWIMGMPTREDSRGHYQLDRRGRLETLRSQAWTVEYSDYRTIEAMDDLALPAKVQLKSPDGRIKVAVRRWTLY